MDHPEVRAWLEEAALLPGGLDAPAEEAVAAHLESCPACAAERESLRATSVALDLAIGPPLAARERVLANVRLLGRERGGQAGSERRGLLERAAGRLSATRPRAALALMGLAAAILLAGAVATIWLARDAPPSRLAMVATQMAEVAAQPDARPLTLRDRDGAAAGLVLHSASADRLVVMSAALEPSDSGRYNCYLERDGQRSEIGPMHFEAEMSFWAGPMSGPEDAGRVGDRFVVLDPSGEVPVLTGEF